VSFWQKLFGLLAIVALLVLAQIGMHLHRWYRFGEERVVLQDLRERGTDVGVDVIRSRARADTLSRTVAALDEELERRVAELRAFEEHMEGQAPSASPLRVLSGADGPFRAGAPRS
jgi:hypothetical protein